MSKRIYLAPAAGGKTNYVLNLARRRAASLQAEVRVCVPNPLQALAWQRRLAEAGGAIGIHVLTFDKLVATCLQQAGEAYTELSEPVLHRLLRQIIADRPLAHYASLQAKQGFVQVAFSVISELKAARVHPTTFAGAVEALGDEARLRELAEIYNAYQKMLGENHWADRLGLHWLAVEALQERAPSCCRDWPLLIVDGFDDFYPSQLDLLELLAERAGDFVMTLTQPEKVTYPRYERTRQHVERALGIAGAALPGAGHRETQQTLHRLAANLFSLSAMEPAPASGTIVLQEAPDMAAEARAALRWLKQRIVHDGISPDQVALLARSITPYRSFIEQTAAEFGLPLRLVDGLPLRSSPIITALLELLRLFLPAEPGGEAELPRRAVIAAWRSPYFSWGEGEEAITTADADRLDQLARDQRVIRGLSQWQAAFAAGAKARERDARDEEQGGALRGEGAQEMKTKFDHFLSLAQPPEKKRPLSEFVAWLEMIIGPDPKAPGVEAADGVSLYITARARANPETEAADIAALGALKDILRGLVWAEAVGATRPAIDFNTFFSELSGAVSASQFTCPGRAEQRAILVADVPQARGLSFAAVAVLGLSEGAFPAAINEDPFLRDADRERLQERLDTIGLQPSTQSAEREYFYEGVTRARQKLLLTRPILAENGAEWVASPFWEAVQRLVTAGVEPIVSEALLPLGETASWAEWWEMAAAWGEPAVAGSAHDPHVWPRIETAARIWAARAKPESSIWDGTLDCLAADLAQRYGPHTIWSATRLEAYQTCSFFFFAQNVLDLRPRAEPAEGLDTRQLGSLYHRLFEQVTRAPGLDPTDEEQVRATVLRLGTPILDAAPEEEGFRETPWWEHTRREIIDNVVQSVLILAGGDYEFFRAERRFGISGPPLDLSDGDDRLQLRGFIDRLDRDANGRLRVVDYKLGGPGNYQPRHFREGKKLQLPLYALAAQEALGLGEVADGFYWHFRSAEASGFQLAKAEGGVAGAMETAVAHAWDAVRQIRSGRFQPEPPAGGCPAYCAAAAFCWHYTPRNY